MHQDKAATAAAAVAVRVLNEEFQLMSGMWRRRAMLKNATTHHHHHQFTHVWSWFGAWRVSA